MTTKHDPLLDIVPETEEVAGVTLSGLSIEDCVALMRKYSAIADMFAGRGVEADRLFAVGPQAIHSILAASAGRSGDEAAEAALARLPLGTQTQMIDVTLRLTWPEGLDDFRDRLLRLASVLGDGSAPAAAEAGGSQGSPKS